MANISTDFSTWSGTAASNQPDSGDTATVQADLQAIQAALRTIFPSVNAAVTPTHTELNYVDGVTSAIQTQIDAKAATADIQAQTPTFFTTGGTSTAYTLTPSPALGSLTTGHRFNVKFNATAGATPTLAISGLTAKSLKLYDSSGAKVAASATTIIANMIADVVYDGTDYVVLDQLPPVASSSIGFSAYETSSQTLASGVAEQVDFTNEAFDDGSCFAASTFTAPIAGVYVFTAAVRANATNMTNFTIAFYKNGSADQAVAADNISPALTVTLVRSGTQVYKLAASDTIKVYVTVSGTTPTVLNGAGAAASSFTGALLYPT